jgi:hypothetical protein
VTSLRRYGEGSIFPYRNGFAACVWITTPLGKRQRKYMYGRTGQIATADGWSSRESRPRAGSHQGADNWAVHRSWLEGTVAPNLAR